jgi:hypothetical protein
MSFGEHKSRVFSGRNQPDGRFEPVAALSQGPLNSHRRVFPQGQLVAEAEGRIVGAAASPVVNQGPDPLRHQTRVGTTDSGYFTNLPDAANMDGAGALLSRGAAVWFPIRSERAGRCRLDKLGLDPTAGYKP